MSDPEDPPEPSPKPYRTRSDGWTAARRGTFFRALAETGCVRDACRVAAISSTSAYRMKDRDPEFAAEWARAREEAQPGLEAAAWKRAVEGVEEPIVSGGKIIGQKRKYSDALLRMLIQRGDMKDAMKRHPDFLSAEEVRDGWTFDAQGHKFHQGSPDEIRARIEAKLEEMNRRLTEGEGPPEDWGEGW